MLAVIAVLALLSGACTRGFGSSSGSINAKPLDLYAALPSLSDVRALLGADNWWPGPPSFGVRPLDVATMAPTESFSITQRYVHIGTNETFVVDYALWSSTSAASSQMSTIQNAAGTSAAGAKVGDQALYYAAQGSGAAPFETFIFVRVGQIVASINWTLKDGLPRLAQLSNIAAKIAPRLKDLAAGRLRGSDLSASDSNLLPPANLDITLLGTATILVESQMVMIGATSVDALALAVRQHGVTDVVFGDYVLDNDTHMEVRASVLTFATTTDATDWVAPFLSGTAVGQDGYYDVANGWYVFAFAAGTKAAMLICRSTAASEAASRACEAPLSRVVAVWKLSLAQV